MLFLPPELLADIFEWYIEMDGSPWRLVDVCRHWNEIAFSTGRLWRSITIIQDGAEHQQRTYDSDSATQICLHPTDVQVALDRAASSPLNLTVTFSSSYSSLDFAKQIMKSDANTYVLLASIISRCENLYLKTSATGRGADLFDYVELADIPALDRLRVLTIGPNWRNRIILNNILDALQGASRGLDELRLQSPAIYPDLSQYPYAARQIRHLVLLDTSPSAVELENLLCPLQNVVDMRSTADWSNRLRLDPSSSIDAAQLLPSMTECKLYHTVLDGWGGRQYPSLQNLQIENCRIIDEPYSIDLPALKTLVLQQEYWAKTFRALLCPRLDTLTLYGGPQAAVDSNLDIARTFSYDYRQPTPRFLSIHVRADDEDLIASFRHISSLEELDMLVYNELRADTLREKLFAALSDATPSETVSSVPVQGIFLPSLRKITIRYEDEVHADAPTLVDNAKVSWQKVKQAREALGVLLDEFRCVILHGDVKVCAFSLLDDTTG
jgi:hypothetical protein